MKKLFLSVVLVLAAVLGFAQVNPQAPLELDKKVLTGKLDNGLTYYVMHNEKPAQMIESDRVTYKQLSLFDMKDFQTDVNPDEKAGVIFGQL